MTTNMTKEKPAARPSAPATREGVSTLAVHAGEHRQKYGDAITDAIFCSSTFTFPDTQAVIDFIVQKQPREEYGRYGNPSEKFVEQKLAALEGGEAALLYSSGMAAIVGVLMAKLNAGDEVIFFDECYHRSREFCAKHLSHLDDLTAQFFTTDLAKDAVRKKVTALYPDDEVEAFTETFWARIQDYLAAR